AAHAPQGARTPAWQGAGARPDAGAAPPVLVEGQSEGGAGSRAREEALRQTRGDPRAHGAARGGPGDGARAAAPVVILIELAAASAATSRGARGSWWRATARSGRRTGVSCARASLPTARARSASGTSAGSRTASASTPRGGSSWRTSSTSSERAGCGFGGPSLVLMALVR